MYFLYCIKRDEYKTLFGEVHTLSCKAHLEGARGVNFLLYKMNISKGRTRWVVKFADKIIVY